MKRLRSFDDDLDCKDWERRDRDRDRDSRDLDRLSSHTRRFNYKAENGGRSRDDDREVSRSSRKSQRNDYDLDGFDRIDRRKSSDRYRESNDSSSRGGGGVSNLSPRGSLYGSGSERIHRSESFSGFRRDFPKGYVSERERERARREESVSSWRRLSGCKDVEEDLKPNVEIPRGGGRGLLEDRVNGKSPQGSRESLRSPQSSRDVLRSPQSSKEALKSPQSSREALRSPQSSREAIRSPQSSRETLRSPQKSREVIRSPQSSREAARSPQSSREAARSPQSSRETERSSQSLKDVLRSPQSSRETERSSQSLKDVLRSPQSSRETERSSQSLKDVLRSPQSSRDIVKSPSESKNSYGEQSKNCEVKKGDEVLGDSGSSSEMEEGELEPEPEIFGQPAVEATLPSKEDSKSQDDDQSNAITEVKDEASSWPENKSLEDLKTVGIVDNNEEGKMVETMETGLKETDGLQENHSCKGINDPEEREAVDIIRQEKVKLIRGEDACSIYSEHIPVEQSDMDQRVDDTLKQKGGKELEAKDEEANFMDPIDFSAEESRRTDKTLSLMSDTLNGKDKGKSVATFSSCDSPPRANNQWAARDLFLSKDDAMEGPSSRGFELFSCSSMIKPEKANQSSGCSGGKMKSEPLELSLGLPDVLLPLVPHDSKAAPSSHSRARSGQSLPNTFRTTSEGFSGSMSFSGSQTFHHNPSCSLTQNSFANDYEQSVGSRPIFQGVFQGVDQQVSHTTWSGKSLVEPKPAESPMYQRSLHGNSSNSSQMPQGVFYNQGTQIQEKFIISEGSSGIPVSQDRPSSLHKQVSGLQSQNNNEARSPTNSIGSRETRSEFSKDKKHILKERNGNLHRSNSQRDMEQHVISGTGFVERIITMIVSEPVQVMARRIEEMADQSITFLKECACEIMSNKDKRGQMRAYKAVLQNRCDLTVENLTKSHRAQLEIFVAFKTGSQDFLRKSSNIASSDLAEIYHHLRCRNLACLSLLPVEECDCKVCAQKNGFCSACMCLLCSKFDMALNTCSWVGCDVCLHWCHTDCGLQKSYIRSGQDATEMQFHCVACNHPSEMFGFVKDVFVTCAKDWKIETLSKELEYVKRIFAASNDPKGKQLHILADQMIGRLQVKSNLSEVYTHIMRFLAETSTETGNTVPPKSKEIIPHKNPVQENNMVAGPSEAAMWIKSTTVPQRLDWDPQIGRSENLEVQGIMAKPHIDELESIIRIKQAEANMFQARADDARKEAEGLQRIAVAKNEKIDEEYKTRITKLRLAEAEGKRKQKIEELKVMEREHREYFNMKMKMESEIRVLLLKMDATKRNFGS